jgi:hypothetical protein
LGEDINLLVVSTTAESKIINENLVVADLEILTRTQFYQLTLNSSGRVD